MSVLPDCVYIPTCIVGLQCYYVVNLSDFSVSQQMFWCCNRMTDLYSLSAL